MTFAKNSVLLSCRLISIFRQSKLQWCSISNRYIMDNNENSKVSMEIVNVPPIVSTYRQALRTFDLRCKQDLSNNLVVLKRMMDNIRAEDLGFDKTFSDPAAWRRAHKAPCTYVEVFQSSLINMSIFILRPGFKMPLHDHPHMHGLLKVISGVVKLRSFTEVPQKNTTTSCNPLKNLASTHFMRHRRRKLLATISNDQVCNADSETCVLTPTLHNFHEIEALDRPAAFFDILSPPYDTLIEEVGPRRCSYYYVDNENSQDIVELHEMDVPDYFYCDQAPYVGPVLV